MSHEYFTRNADGFDHIDKDPDAKLPYSWNLTSWLAAVGGSSLTAVVTLGSGLSAEGSPVIAGGRVTQMIYGGTLGNSYTVTCRATANTGAVDDFTFVIECKTR